MKRKPLDTGHTQAKFIRGVFLVYVMESKDALIVFQGKGIRRIWHEGEWWFSVVDIVAVLAEQDDFQAARKYWNKLSQRLREEGSEVVTNCHRLKLPAGDGKLRETDCANTASIFRIIQSIPSKKAEPFKQWLAKVGHERVQEIENPEIAQHRMVEIYKAKGYSDAWIEKRIRGIQVRQDLTEEWDNRNVKRGREFAILTNEISKATFGKTVGEYKQFKGLDKENLRDHMSGLELIFTLLGEASTTAIARGKDAQGFEENKSAAKEGGGIAGNAMKELEVKSGRKISEPENYLGKPEKVKRVGWRNQT